MQRKTPLCRALQASLATAAALLALCSQATSQQAVQAGATLRVYTNLLQIPVLILNGKHQPVPPIQADKFLLHIDNDAPFRPRVRLEGEDPITLAVLIDGATDGPKLPRLAEGLAAMARTDLHAQDRVTLYGLDGCKLRRTLGLRRTDPQTVLAAAQALQNVPPFVHHWRGEKCASPIALWDAVAWVAQALQGEPGRRVLLVVSNGADGGSKLEADAVRSTATLNGVAIFSMAERFKITPGIFTRNAAIGPDITSALAYISEGTGGMVMETTRSTVVDTLARFPALLRGRYIVEFSRPAGITSGQHALKVTVGQPKDFIRAAGTSMPVADPVARDPAVQHGTLDPAFRLEASDAEAGDPAPPHVGEPVAPPQAPVASPVVPAPAGKPVADPLDVTEEARPVPAPVGTP